MIDKKLRGGIARLTAAILAILALLLSPAPSALASVTIEGNTANVATGDYANQTIIDEGDNDVTVLNKTEDSPSPTGIAMANLPILVIGAFVVAGSVVIIARAKRKAGESDE